VLDHTFARLRHAPDYECGRSDAAIDAMLDMVERDWGTGDIWSNYTPSQAGDERLRRWWNRCGRLTLSPASAVAFTRMIADSDVRSLLPSIQAPTLVVSGTDPFRAARCQYLVDHIADAKWLQVSGEDTLSWLNDAIAAEIEEFLTGVRPAPESDRVLATVLMTDIVESTSRTASVGDRAWRDLLDRHDAIVRAELDRHRGKKVNSIGLGDGVLATFDGPARACRCACALHESIRSSLGIDIRAGLHTGEIELRGDDVTGMAVNIAARVMGLANASETLVSRTVTDLVAGSGLQFAERGEHELKGVQGKWAIYAVTS
jgi:class 3 adenylate cyclase